MLEIFESHAHYDSSRFLEDRHDVLYRVHKSGVRYIVNVGCDINTSKKSIELANKFDYIYASVGIHPSDANNVDSNYIDELKIMSNQIKVVALGEMGLDYHYNDYIESVQKRVFINQLNLASQLNMPVIIHSRDSFLDTINILSQFSHIYGVIHCYGYDINELKEFLKLNYYIGITGAVTFAKSYSLLRVVEALPLDRLFIETDCPYMAPIPYRGKRCDSSMLINIVEKIAEIKKITVEQVINVTRQNCFNLFKKIKKISKIS